MFLKLRTKNTWEDKKMKKFCVARNGEIIFIGTEDECIEIIENDVTGEFELYTLEAIIR